MLKRAGKIVLPLLICLVFMITLLPGCDNGTATTTTTKAPTTTSTTTPVKTTTPVETTTPTINADKIIIGASRSVTGPLSIYEQSAFGPIYKMWVDEINAAGGLEVGGKKLPIEMIVYDDASDPALLVKNLEKLCTEDKVDFLFGPCGTAMLFAAAPIADKYNKIMICAEGGCTTLEPKLGDFPYLFSVLNYSNHFQIPVFADICVELGLKTAYIAYISDLHGAEYNLTAQSEFTLKGITIVDSKSFPAGTKDLDSIINAAKAANADIFCCFAYPDENILAMNTLMTLDYNPKAVVFGPGANFGFFKAIFGDKLQGVMGEGAWNMKSSPKASEFVDKFIARYGEAGKAAFGAEDALLDWWGHLVYYSALEHFAQCIQKAVSLDNATVRELMATEKFETTLGTMWWDCANNGAGGGLLPYECYSGQIGQWQNGVFEVVDPGDKRTADPIIKPEW